MDFIEDYTNFILEHHDTSPDWAESIACNVLATAMGKKIRIETRIGALYPNLFFLVIGPSRIAEKTNPLKYMAIPTLIKLGELTKSRKLLPSKFSVEGMIEYLSKHGGEGMIIRDEFTSLFKEASHKDYNADILEFLSEMYDGMIQSRYTRKMKLEEVRDVYVPLLSATTTYIFKVMKLDFFIQGTGNRFLFIWHSPSKFREVDATFFLSGERAREVESKLDEFARRLHKFADTPHEFIEPVFVAGDKMAEFKNKMAKKAKELFDQDQFSIESSYAGSMAEMAMKLSTLKCISRNEKLFQTKYDNKDTTKRYHELSQRPLLENPPITRVDVDWAINKIKRHMEHFQQLKQRWGLVVDMKPVVTSEQEFEYVKQILKMNGGRMIHTHLWNRTKWTLKKFNEIMGAMVMQEVVRVEKGAGSKKGGPKPSYYVLAEEEVS